MQFVRNKKRSRRNLQLEGDYDPSRYPHSLFLYSLPPSENLSLQEFEEFAIERLKVLKILETVGIRHVKGSPDYNEAITKEFRQLSKQGTFRAATKKCDPGSEKETGLSKADYEDRRKDYISHFILRLAYCRSEELRRWFIQQEVDLFRYRFGQESDESIRIFLKLNKLNYTPIPESERKALSQQLTESTPGQTAAKLESTAYYKVPFTDVLDLVRLRRLYLKAGFAYVPHSDLVLIILSHFRSSLSYALAVTQRAMPLLEEDGRLLPLLGNLSNRYLGQDYTNKKATTGEVTADMIDALSKKSFPLCMSHIHQSLRTHHHLRHWGRMQYGLFLKAIGLSLEEAMKFWRAEFSKTVDPDKFEKQYAYNIRHNYGKEGKRANYTPYSCIKIITTNAPAVGDHHGCPFKHSDVDLLRQKLQGLRVSKEGIDEITDLVKRHHYQVACGRYFEYTHNVNIGFSPNHPNQYFEESQRVHNGGRPEGIATPQRGTPVIVRSQKSSQVSTPQARNKTTDAADEFDDFPISDMDLEMAMSGVEEATTAS